MDSPRFVTLTLATTAEPLDREVARLVASFRRLRQRRAWKHRVFGGIAAIEITWTKDGWHPHIHAIVDGVYFDHRILSSEWFESTQDSKIVHIKPINGRKAQIDYLCKYASKGISLRSLPDDRIAEFALAMRGVRMLQSFGKSHGVYKAEPSIEEENKPAIIVHEWDDVHRDATTSKHAATLLDLATVTAARSKAGECSGISVRGLLGALHAYAHRNDPVPPKHSDRQKVRFYPLFGVSPPPEPPDTDHTRT